MCVCPSNFTGTRCDVDVDECAVDNGGCGHTATCVNRENGFDCFDCPEQNHLAMAYPNFAEQSSCETVMTVECVSALDVDADGFIGADFLISAPVPECQVIASTSSEV
jgi:hypothetical protein